MTNDDSDLWTGPGDTRGRPPDGPHDASGYRWMDPEADTGGEPADAIDDTEWRLLEDGDGYRWADAASDPSLSPDADGGLPPAPGPPGVAGGAAAAARRSRWVRGLLVLAVAVVALAVWSDVQSRLDEQARAIDELTAGVRDLTVALGDAGVDDAGGATGGDGGSATTGRTPLMPPLTPTGPVPAVEPGAWIGVPDAGTSRAEITRVVLLVLTRDTPEDERLAHLAIDGDTGPLVEQLLRSSCVSAADPVVTSIVFTGPDSADVRFAFQGPRIRELGYERSAELAGTVQRAGDGRWLVTEDSLRATVDAVLTYCPS